MTRLGAASGLAVSAGILGVVVFTGAPSVEWTNTASEGCTPSSSDTASSDASVSTEPASSDPASDPATSAPSSESTEPQPEPTTEPAQTTTTDCAASSSTTTTTPPPTTTTTQPRTAPRASEPDSGGASETSETSSPTSTSATQAIQPGSQNGQQPPAAGGMPLGQAPQGLAPERGRLPEIAVPVEAVHPDTTAPEFGILGPDSQAVLAARELATGAAQALPSERMPGMNPVELGAVCALALAAGLLTRRVAHVRSR